MKITIIGPGAMGILFALLLTKSKAANEIYILDNNKTRAKSLNNSGLSVEGVINFKAKVKITSDIEILKNSDLVIIAVKSYKTDEVIKSIKSSINSNAKIITMQNGIGNLEIISEVVSEDRALAGSTSYAAHIISGGKIKYTASGETIIGRSDGKIFGDLKSIAHIFNSAGIKTRMSKDIKSVIWSKLVINAGINALAAVTRLPNGELLKHDSIKELLRLAVSEAAKVAKRKKIKLIYDDPIQKAESVCVATASNICSMLSDVLNKRQTEIDSINGAISRHGRSVGIKTPVNDMLLSLIKTIELTYSQQVQP